MYNNNTDLLGLILGAEVFFLLVTVQEHCDQYPFHSFYLGDFPIATVIKLGEHILGFLYHSLFLLSKGWNFKF